MKIKKKTCICILLVALAVVFCSPTVYAAGSGTGAAEIIR